MATLTKEQVDLWIMSNSKFLPNEKLMYVKEKLLTLDENRWVLLQSMDFNDPLIFLLISIFVGTFGVDRFLLGDIGMGVLKLLTGGLCGVLWLIDVIGIQNKAKEANFTKLMMFL